MKFKTTLISLAVLATTGLAHAQVSPAVCRAPNPAYQPALTAAQAEMAKVQADRLAVEKVAAQRVNSSRTKDEAAQKQVQTLAVAHTSRIAVARYWEDVSRMPLTAPSTEVATVRTRHMNSVDAAMADVSGYAKAIQTQSAQEKAYVSQRLKDLKAEYAQWQSKLSSAERDLQEQSRIAVTEEAAQLGRSAAEEIVSAVRISEQLRQPLLSRAELTTQAARSLASIQEVEAYLSAMDQKQSDALDALKHAATRAAAAKDAVKAQSLQVSAAAKRVSESRSAETAASAALVKAVQASNTAGKELEAAVYELAKQRQYTQELLTRLEARIAELKSVVYGTC